VFGIERGGALTAGRDLAISEITQAQFEGLGLPESCRALWSQAHECNWFADDSGAVVGVLLFNTETDYWGYVMCARVAGDFKRFGVGSDFTRFEMARRDLLASMERHIEASA
jgi:hypothetical protein